MKVIMERLFTAEPNLYLCFMGNNNFSIMEKRRIAWVDSLKGGLMILVILGHAIQTVMIDSCESSRLWNMIYSFHMPAFMAVSGWFAYRHSRIREGYLTYCKRRGYQLLFPFFVWSIFRWCLGDCSLSTLFNIIINPDSSFWFLWVLFWICILFVFGQWLADRLHIDELIPISIICIILLAAMILSEFRMFGFQFQAYYFLFYLVGYCVHRFSVLQIKNIPTIIILTIAWAALAWFWNMHTLPAWIPTIPHIPSTLVQYAYRGLTALIAVLLLFGVAPKVLDNDTMFNGLIQKLGVVSLGLYVIHLTFLGYIKDFIKMIIPFAYDWLLIVLVFFATFFFSIVTVEILKQNKWTVKFCLGKV